VRNAHSNGRIVLVLNRRVRDPNAEVSPEPNACAYIEQRSATNRVYRSDGTSLGVNRKRRAVGKRLILRLAAEIHVKEKMKAFQPVRIF